MLTLFAIPKAFRGHIGVIQLNAIASWTRLGIGSRVVLFGDDEGTADVAREFHLEHVPEVARNEFGTPLISDVFQKARQLARDDVLCYVNSDIILLNEFVPAVDRVRERRNRFLMVGECWNVDVQSLLQFDDPTWQAQLLRRVCEGGVRRGASYIDYFVFSQGLYDELPPFAVGRAGFDNWLLWKARDLGATVVDASRVITAVHQNHDYAHVTGGREWSYGGAEAVRNVQLAGGTEHLYLICDASHKLTARSLRRNLGGWSRLRFHWETEVCGWLASVGWLVLDLTRPIRHPLGLRAATLQRVTAVLPRILRKNIER